MKELSIIMPVKDGEKEIKKTINKILESDFKNFELIIINDSSKDETVKKIKEIKDKRIKILNNKNNIGITKSLIRGIGISKGKYLARIDCADYVTNDRFSKQIEWMKKNSCDCVSSFVRIIDEKGKKIMIKKHKNSNIKRRLTYGNIFTHSSLMFTKNIYEKVGGYNPKIYYAQDYDLLLKISENGKICEVPEILLDYTYGKGISNNKRKAQEKSVIKIKYDMFKRRKNISSIISICFGIISYLIPVKLKKMVTKI